MTMTIDELKDLILFCKKHAVTSFSFDSLNFTVVPEAVTLDPSLAPIPQEELTELEKFMKGIQ